jgi:PKD repeat protein
MDKKPRRTYIALSRLSVLLFLSIPIALVWSYSTASPITAPAIEVTNQPPVAGFTWSPLNPNPGEQITFNASSSFDPDGSIILYEWDWDYNGIYEETLTVPTTTHVWADHGAYLVTLRVTDNESLNDTVTKQILILGVINIDKIQGGFGVSAVIRNTGDSPQTDIPWSIELSGGIIPWGSYSEGVISSLDTGMSTTIRQGFIFGVGTVRIIVTVEGGWEGMAMGLVLGPVVLIHFIL